MVNPHAPVHPLKLVEIPTPAIRPSRSRWWWSSCGKETASRRNRLAKLANFCYAKDGSAVSAVDFQYVGGGCGMKDVAYFVGSCLYEEDCKRYESKILDCYFSHLKEAFNKQSLDICYEDVETEWRNLYAFAWADFHRFLKGWSPGHWKINSYSEQVSLKVAKSLL